MWIEFEKWHGNSNDFIVLWQPITQKDNLDLSLRRAASLLCDRTGKGIGADGILVMYYHHGKDDFLIDLTIINSDGSLAVTCGNGLRCAALVAKNARQQQNPQGPLHDYIEFRLINDQVTMCQIWNEKSSIPFVRVEMGQANYNAQNPWHVEATAQAREIVEKLHLSAEILEYETCHIGNNHLVLTCEKASVALAENLGPKLQKIAGLDGINVHFIHIQASNNQDHKNIPHSIQRNMAFSSVHAICWERGAGLTQACGSGAASIGGLLVNKNEEQKDQWISVHMPGGFLYVMTESSENKQLLAGTAQRVFFGKLEI